MLACGFAGEPLRTPSVTLYERSRVEALVSWPVLREEDRDAACPGSLLFVARRTVAVGSHPDEQLVQVARGWGFGPYVAAWLGILAKGEGFVLVVATVSGFVARGAELVNVLGEGDRRYRLVLREAGSWFEIFRGHRLLTGAGPSYALLRVPPVVGQSRP